MPNWILLLNFSTCKERFNTSLLLHFLKYIFVSKVSTPLFYILCTGDPIFLGVSNLIRQQTTPKHIGQAHSEFFNKMFFFSKSFRQPPPLSLSSCNRGPHSCQVQSYNKSDSGFFLYIFFYIYFFFLGIEQYSRSDYH